MEVVDQANKNVKLDLETLSSVFPKGVSANLLVTGSVYIIGQSFGISWRIEMAQVFPPNRITASSVFEEVQEVPEAEAVAASSTVSEAQEVEAEAESASPTLVAPARKRRAAVNPA